MTLYEDATDACTWKIHHTKKCRLRDHIAIKLYRKARQRLTSALSDWTQEPWYHITSTSVGCQTRMKVDDVRLVECLHIVGLLMFLHSHQSRQFAATTKLPYPWKMSWGRSEGFQSTFDTPNQYDESFTKVAESPTE